MRKPTIIASLIAAGAVIAAALITIYPSIRNQAHSESIVISGTVVDRDTNQGVGQAAIFVAGRTEQYTTEDSGNFRMILQANTSKLIRLRITKPGFRPLDRSVKGPAENMILQLQKQ